MKKIVLAFGLTSGFIMSAMMLATLPFQMEMDLGSAHVVGYATMVAAGLLIFFGVRRYRDTMAGGSMRFGRAFAVGMLIVLVSSTVYTAAWEIAYFGGFYPNFWERYAANVLEGERASGTSQAELEEKRADLEKWGRLYQNPAINSAITFFEPLPVGLIVSLVSAGVLTRRRRERGASVSGVPA